MNCVEIKPLISTEKRTLPFGEKLEISYRCDVPARVDILNYNEDVIYNLPFTFKNVEGSGKVVFDTSEFPAGPGYYRVFLCDPEGLIVYESFEVLLSDESDAPDEGALSAEVSVREENDVKVCSVSVRTKSATELHYGFYWYGGGHRLENYTPLWEGDRAGDFTAELHPSVFVPDEADSIEIAVGARTKNSLIIPAPDAIRPPKGEPVCRFEVFTDIHANKNHIYASLRHTMRHDPKSDAIFTCGDNTNTGSQADYDILHELFDPLRDKLPPLYFGLGNHDIVCGVDYDEQIRLFCDNLHVPAAHYHVDLCGQRIILLGSDVKDGEGILNDEQLDWAEKLMSEVEPGKPIFVILHQPLIETVSGSLASINEREQCWSGVRDAADRLHAMFGKYPNTVLFTGHSHWKFDSISPIKFCGKNDATFVNCASVGDLWGDEYHFERGSEGYFVEVYEDHVRLRGREFVRDKWSADSQYVIPLYR
ncbi:MAG: metallophosphoesterase [Clostridia bacterium]|nr:metallophosphoesterase [Clostridia bacterium]